MKLKQYLILGAVVIIGAVAYAWLGSDPDTGSASGATVAVTMYKNPGCECCAKWAAYLERRGFEVETKPMANMTAVKDQEGVPAEMQSCHTAVIGDYVVEGHVPAEDIRRMLKEQPQVTGIAAPGMPASSPGMNTAFNQPYNVYTFGGPAETVFAKH